jgi:preprotein translocase subunit YajC
MLALIVPLAQAAPPTGGSSLPSMLIPLVLIFVVFYFFMIRPQSRRDKERRAMIEAVKKGDKVVSVGGIHGTVVQVDEGSLLVQVDNNVKLRFEKNAVASVAS